MHGNYEKYRPGYSEHTHENIKINLQSFSYENTIDKIQTRHMLNPTTPVVSRIKELFDGRSIITKEVMIRTMGCDD